MELLKMRRKDREITSLRDITDIVDKAKILHLGLVDDGCPYVVPLHYGYVREGNMYVFYMHSANEGHKLDLIKENSNVCIELECDVEMISGGNVPCKYGASYKSFIGRGCAEIVDDAQEKVKGLNIFMQHQTRKEFDIDEAMASSVTVIRVRVEEFTAKSKL